jgi:hypothetical protein
MSSVGWVALRFHSSSLPLADFRCSTGTTTGTRFVLHRDDAGPEGDDGLEKPLPALQSPVTIPRISNDRAPDPFHVRFDVDRECGMLRHAIETGVCSRARWLAPHGVETMLARSPRTDLTKPRRTGAPPR